MYSRYYVTIILALTIIGICATTFIADAQQAPPALCSVLIKDSLNQVGTSCANLALNTTCYGYPTVQRSTLTNSVSTVDPAYSQPGSLADLKTTNLVLTTPSDTNKNMWGVNIMDVQANLPDSTIKGLVYIQFGGLQLVNGSGAGEKPMQNVVLSAIGGGTPCADAPPFMLVQAPESTTPRVVVNGVEIEMHSTIIVSVEACVLRIGVIMGSIIINPGVNQIIVTRGESITVPLDSDCKLATGNYSTPALDPTLTGLGEVIGDIPNNLLNYIPNVPIISCPSGVGGPDCVLVNPL